MQPVQSRDRLLAHIVIFWFRQTATRILKAAKHIPWLAENIKNLSRASLLLYCQQYKMEVRDHARLVLLRRQVVLRFVAQACIVSGFESLLGSGHTCVTLPPQARLEEEQDRQIRYQAGAIILCGLSRTSCLLAYA